MATRERIRRYTEVRLRRWLMRRSGFTGIGLKRFPTKYLHETFGRYDVRVTRRDLSNAKA
jgi:hypothetical protein